MSPRLKVVLEDDKFLVRDESGYNYGASYDSKEKAQIDLHLWDEYYRNENNIEQGN